MQKGWFVILIVFGVVLSSSAYSKLSENEKSRLEECPLKTYINIWGDGVRDSGCKDIVIDRSYDELYLNTSCDWYAVEAFRNTAENNLGGKASRVIGSNSYKLYNFRANDNPFFLACQINGTRLKDLKEITGFLIVSVRSRFEIESTKTQKAIQENLEKQLNRTEESISKSEKTLKGINETKTVIDEINRTVQQTNTTLTEERKEKNCKEKFGLIPESLLIIFNIILAFIGYLNKRNKKLRRRLIILAVISLILWFVFRVGIMIIC